MSQFIIFHNYNGHTFNIRVTSPHVTQDEMDKKLGPTPGEIACPDDPLMADFHNLTLLRKVFSDEVDSYKLDYLTHLRSHPTDLSILGEKRDGLKDRMKGLEAICNYRNAVVSKITNDRAVPKYKPEK